MKKLIRIAVVALAAPFFAAFTPENDLPQPGDQLAAGYYIVVAAYRQPQESYAKWFMEKLNKGGLHSTYGYDPTRQWLYVYLDYYTDFNESVQVMLKTRKEGGFADAWVRVMPAVPGQPVQEVAIQPVPEEKKETEKAVVVTEEKKEGNAEIKEIKSNPVEVVVTETAIENPKADPVIRPQLLSNTPVFLSLFNPRNNKVIEGEVQLVDTDRARLITRVKGNDYVTLPDPKNNSGSITMICEVFGYRKVQHEINYKKTEADTLKPFIHLVGNYYLVDFDLVRLHRGDIATLYNVYFYNDAAIMLPESTYELNSLLQMMKENPAYKIRLHGHTNGNAHGTLITMGPSRNFFAIADDSKKGVGSAKDLSRERAETIKQWMVANGIDATRMEVKAWGGSRMIHDKRSVNAKQNVRVEVEVLED